MYNQCKDMDGSMPAKLETSQPNTTHLLDSDVAKWIEAAAYSLATHPDPALDSLLDAVITLFLRQQPDAT